MLKLIKKAALQIGLKFIAQKVDEELKRSDRRKRRKEFLKVAMQHAAQEFDTPPSDDPPTVIEYRGKDS